MSCHRNIDVRIWEDAWFRSLTPIAPSGAGLWLYLKTAPSEIPGVLRIGEAALAELLGWPIDPFRAAFGEVSQHGKAKANWQARLIFTEEVLRQNKPANPNIIRSWRDAWTEIPDCELKSEIQQMLTVYCTELGAGFAKSFSFVCGNGLANGLANHSPNGCPNGLPNHSTSDSKEPRFDPLEVDLPPDLDTPAFRTTWKKWIAYRRKRKLTCTEQTIDGQLKKLAELGHDHAIEEIEEAIANGWQSVAYRGKVNGHKSRGLFEGPAGFAGLNGEDDHHDQ